MYDLPLITIEELSADDYERLGPPIPFNDPEFRPLVRITIDTGLTKTTHLGLLQEATLQGDYVMAP